jgi:hypothetical protein
MTILESELSRSHCATHSHHNKQQKQRSALDALPPMLSDDQVLTFGQWVALNKGRATVPRPAASLPQRLAVQHFINRHPELLKTAQNRIGVPQYYQPSPASKIPLQHQYPATAKIRVEPRPKSPF